MKALFLALSLISFQALASEALTTDSMDEVIAKVEEKSQQYGRENVLMVFDIDNTILTSVNDFGSDQWYTWQEKLSATPNCQPACVSNDFNELIAAQGLLYTIGQMKATESDLAVKLKALQAKGQKIILLTSRGPEFRSVTEAALAKNGMTFEKSTIGQAGKKTSTYIPYDIKKIEAAGLNQNDVAAAGLKEARPVSFMNGVYMTAGQNKGVMLKVLLNRYKKDYKAIIFSDDLAKHVQRMQAIMGNISDVTTFRYSKIDPEVERFEAMDKTEMIEKWTKLKNTIKEIGL